LAPPGPSFSDHSLEVPVLFDGENLLDAAAEWCGGCGEPTSQRLELPGTFIRVHFAGPDSFPESLHLLHQRGHLSVHGALQLLKLGHLILRQPKALLVFQ
jgi:hypothetical protein